MKIALVTEFYYPHTGGVTEHVHQLALYLLRKGHQVRVVTNHVAELPRRAARESVGEFEVVRIGRGVAVESNGSKSRVTVGFGLERKMRLALDGCDLVHVHSPLFPMLPYLALKVAKRRGIAAVGTYHTHFDGSKALRTFGPILRRYANTMSRVIAVSDSAARAIAPYFSAPYEVIPNGVNIDGWSAGGRVDAHPELYDGRKNIAFLGRLDPRNDVAVLLQAFALMKRDDVRLLLIGDGPARAGYEASLPSELRDRVLFAGAHSDLAMRAAFMAASHVMAFTARIASHPMALIEGMAAGKPVVAYDIEGVRELILDGREGYKVPVSDAGALADALENVLSDEARRRVMGKLARTKAEPFDWRWIGERIENVYAAALGSNGLEERIEAPVAIPAKGAVAR